MKSLDIVLQEQSVAKENANKLLEAYGVPFEEAGEILRTYKDIEVIDESQTDLMKEAREKRLALKKVRTSVENKRKELKADYLVITNAIDGVARYIKSEIEPAEEYLELQEKFAETKEAERRSAKKAERIEKLSPYIEDLSIYNLETITDENFDILLAKSKKDYEDKIEAEKQAEIARQKEIEAEKKRQAEIEAENARLKAEAEKRAEEEAKREAEREKERQIEADRLAKIQAEKDKELAEERAKLQAIEDRRKAEEEAEARAKAEADEKERQEMLAPDKDKLIKFSDAITVIVDTKLPAVRNKQAQDVVNYIESDLSNLVIKIKSKAKEL